jgi:hypothetical protein
VNRRYVRGTPDERFDTYLKSGPLLPGMATPCILWTGPTNPKGYGQFSIRAGRSVLAHRFALARAIGPDRRLTLHSCDNPPCCNPDHLRYGTNDENMAQMVERGRAARGQQKARTKLTEQIVLEARRRVRDGESANAIAAQFEVPRDAIYSAVTGRTWAYLPDAIPNIRQHRMDHRAT